MSVVGRSAVVAAVGGAVVGGYLGLVTGALPVDLGIGRRTRPLGPFGVDIDAPLEVVFDVLSEPYLGRQTRAVAEKIRVLERGSDMVLAAPITGATTMALSPWPARPITSTNGWEARRQ